MMHGGSLPCEAAGVRNSGSVFMENIAKGEEVNDKKHLSSIIIIIVVTVI